MKIAVDGGAFQQGIAAGIYNVAVGLLNEMRRMVPHLTFVFVVDPRLGPPRPDLLEKLSFAPDLVEAPVGPAYGSPRALTTSDPYVAFEIDGCIVPAQRSGDTFRYDGAKPERLLRVRSRVDRPSLNGLPNGTARGIGIREIRLSSGGVSKRIAFDDPRLTCGFHDPERSLRWTSGAARLPQEIFGPGLDDVSIEVDATGLLDYPLSCFEDPESVSAFERARHGVEVALLERRLEALGCTAYLANHFIPVCFSRLKTYAILYDMMPAKFPQWFFEDARENFGHVTRVFRHARHTFSISDTSRRDLMELAGVEPQRVSTVWLDVDEKFKSSSRRAIATTKKQYGLGAKPYILCVGTVEPRKNHLRLLQAFLASETRHSHRLVIVGKRGWGANDFYVHLDRVGASGDIRLLESVPTDDLPALYGGAAFLAYPSLYEGFGLPVIEAMACGCPVLASHTSSIAEIAAGAALLVDPMQAGEIAAGIDRLASSADLRAELRAKGFERRARFSWTATAACVVEVLDA